MWIRLGVRKSAPSNTAPSRPSCQLIKDRPSLAAAAARAQDNDQLVLLTTRSLKWALTALNAVASLRAHGFDGVLHIVSTQRECQRVLEQDAVPVRQCAWTSEDFLKNRLWVLAQLASMRRYQILMADTDVCFFANPFPWLEQRNRTLILEDRRSNFGQFNLGTVYADGRSGARDLGLLDMAVARDLI